MQRLPEWQSKLITAIELEITNTGERVHLAFKELDDKAQIISTYAMELRSRSPPLSFTQQLNVNKVISYLREEIFKWYKSCEENLLNNNYEFCSPSDDVQQGIQMLINDFHLLQ